MRKWLMLMVFLFLMFPIGAAANDYILGPGDVISINVWGYEDQVSLAEFVIRPDGKLAIPLVGAITAAGLSPEDFSQNITVELSRYLESPKVTVNVLRFRTTQVSVLGEVNHPGQYELNTKSRKLLDAIAMAAGWTKDAAKKKVFILHKDMQGEPQRVNLLALLEKGDISKNLVLSEGDIVYLSENNRINIVSDILPYISSGYMIHNWSSKTQTP